MEDILLLDSIERYLSGAMLPEEKAYFEQLRKNTPEIDEMVVEHKLFLQQMEIYSEHKSLTNTLHEVHNNLVEQGYIQTGEEVYKTGKVIQLWNKYKRVTGIAAFIAGITALIISFLVAELSPSPKTSDIQELSRKINSLEQKTNVLNAEIKRDHAKIPARAYVSGGTGFLIDGKGYIITNAHVLKATGAIVANSKNQEFNTQIIFVDPQKDLAILKIEDSSFTPSSSLPYSIKKSNVSLGEDVFTLGFPREEIVYNMGYLSAKTGFDGDTSSFQISLAANPGNSGGPVFNKNGEVIGVLSTRETQAEGVVFAIKSKNIFQLIDDLKKTDSSFRRIKLAGTSNLKGIDRVQQIKELEDCVFQVKVYNK
ncbi:MAG: S1C family serine protease [Ilyomonas sp.]